MRNVIAASDNGNAATGNVRQATEVSHEETNDDRHSTVSNVQASEIDDSSAAQDWKESFTDKELALLTTQNIDASHHNACSQMLDIPKVMTLLWVCICLS